MYKILLIIFAAFVYYVTMFEMYIDRSNLTYVNPKYFKLLRYTLRKTSRRSPYILNVYQNYVSPLGNNLTTEWMLYEVIAGREILTPLRLSTQMCDALQNDPYIGKLFASGLPKGWTCPFSEGYHNWTITVDVKNFPYVPFTYTSLSVRACLYANAFVNKEPAYKAYVCGSVKQKVGDDKNRRREQKK